VTEERPTPRAEAQPAEVAVVAVHDRRGFAPQPEADAVAAGDRAVAEVFPAAEHVSARREPLCAVAEHQHVVHLQSARADGVAVEEKHLAVL
jgi:hypothetical protein